MAKLGIDVSQVKSPFEPLPEDNYNFKVAEAEVTTSKKGDAMIALQYEVIGHPTLSGRKARNFAMIEGNGKQSGQYLIHQHCLVAGDDPSDPDPETWINSEFEAEVTIEEDDQYGPQNRVTPLVNVRELADETQAVDDQLAEVSI